jgi:BASS family bile acid:Na+ symporter
MTFADVLKMLLMACIFANVFALALRARGSDALYMLRHPGQGLRAFAAMFLVVPAVAVGVALALDLLPDVKLALVALAFSPVPPLLPKKQMKAGGSDSYVIGLMIQASVLSLVAAPLGLALVGQLFGHDLQVSPMKFLPILMIGIGAPLAAGFVAQRLVDETLGARLADGIARIAGVVLLVGVLVLLVTLVPAMWTVIGDGTLLALLAMIVVGLVAGYFLAGGQGEDRSALALAAAARHPGVAIAIAAATFPQAKLAVAAIILSTLLNAVVSAVVLRRLQKA